ncbi:hypothetical protein SAMN05428949_5149 [Chitinophaga sp. YR627]|nr:hypothetical protein SAMN05428949_5149 [Chitinophaga sp. YR627]
MIELFKDIKEAQYTIENKTFISSLTANQFLIRNS